MLDRMTDTVMEPEHYSGLRKAPSMAGRGSGDYHVEEGVLVDDTDFYNPHSRVAVEAHFPLDFRGGGPDPRVDTTTVTVRRVAR